MVCRADLGGEDGCSDDGEVVSIVIGRPLRMRAASARWWDKSALACFFACVLAGLAISLVACSTQSDAAKTPDATDMLRTLPPADSSQYERVQDMKKWRNPYLIVRADGVVLFDATDSAEITLKTDELLPALARLPASYWPYGRVVAAAENNVRTSEQDGVAIRRNKGIVGGMLESAHVVVKWVPAT